MSILLIGTTAYRSVDDEETIKKLYVVRLVKGSRPDYMDLVEQGAGEGVLVPRVRAPFVDDERCVNTRIRETVYTITVTSCRCGAKT